MLRAVTALFATPHLLPLLRDMSEATEQLYDGFLSEASPHYVPLCEQLAAFEETLEGRRKACEGAMPNSIYRDLDAMDKKLHVPRT